MKKDRQIIDELIELKENYKPTPYVEKWARSFIEYYNKNQFLSERQIKIAEEMIKTTKENSGSFTPVENPFKNAETFDDNNAQSWREEEKRYDPYTPAEVSFMTETINRRMGRSINNVDWDEFMEALNHNGKGTKPEDHFNILELKKKWEKK